MRITYDPKCDVLYLKLGEAEKVYCWYLNTESIYQLINIL